MAFVAYHGLANFREAIRNDLAMAQHLGELIAKQHPELELLAPIPLSAVCFRYGSEADADSLNRRILQTVIRRGRVFLSNAGIRGQFALRACIVNHRTTAADVEQVVSEVTAVGRELTVGAGS
jgi:glutamate/tyrosine decarboxylase-like PLP-dependent enzyme